MKKDEVDISYPNQKIIETELTKEMKSAYIDYAMSVIVGRALPDVRDGLKPVHRRILYTMYQENLTYENKFSKSVATVGEVLKCFHPHGDASVYDALVRLAQDFSMRYPLVQGRGNFGSVDGDPPAAYRYTEARMAKISNEMLRDIDKETVDFMPNFDETRQEPVVIPSRFPNLLVNGSDGIAVGMTTKIPPHNLREVIDAVVCVIKNPEATLDDIMQHIKGPDFPTRGIIMGKRGIRAAYATGRGHISVRARTEFETFGQNRTRIIVTELPYQVNKARLIEAIAEQVKEKRMDGISALRDESDRDGMRIVIELKKDANPQVVLNRLFNSTQLQTTFAVVLLALVNNQKQPKILTLREILDEYIAFQKDVIIRRTRYDLKKARERAHLLEGLRIAVDNIDEVIHIIRTSYNDARERLMERFELSQVQAQAILDMQLRRLQGLEREKIEAEYQELQKKIEYYLSLLSDEEILDQVLIDEITELKDKYGDDRRTEIAAVENEIDVEDLIEEEKSIFTLTMAGYIKRTSTDTYRAQRRGGRGITALTTKDEDNVETIFTASTHDNILFFTDTGRVYMKKGYTIPEAGRMAKGTNIVNIIPIAQGEKVTVMMHIREFSDDHYLVMVTQSGTVKRMELSQLKNIRNVGIRALTLDEGDKLISVNLTDGDQNIIIATRMGKALRFNEQDIRAMGRTAAGVRGIRLREGDCCIGAAVAPNDCCILSVTEKGYGKRTNIDSYTLQNRGGQGMANYKINEKTGPLAGMRVVSEDDDIMIISDDGTMIRMPASDISVYGRDTSGVRVMRVDEGVKVISVARIKPEPESESDEDEIVEDENGEE
jgi:DNA gyrase subunit A